MLNDKIKELKKKLRARSIKNRRPKKKRKPLLE
jgi:hypothetical protein